MKKALVGFLILALSAGVFAQEEKEQGLKFSGALKTGIQFQATNEEDVDPSIKMHNDDADKETRFDLNGAFTKDNYGVVFRLRTNSVISGVEPIVHQAYVWGDFLNEIINVKVGKIEDAAWNTDGDEDFYYSTGAGLRLEVKPIEGLNVGLFLNGPNGDSIETAISNDPKNAVDGFIFAKEFLLETSFGAKYENDAFYVAGGLRIDGKADALDKDEDGFYDYFTRDAPEIDPTTPNPTNLEGEDSNKGLGAYIGFGISAVPKLTAIVEARFNNLGDYNKYGWIWVNETLGYAITEQLEAGLVMHQRLFGDEAVEDYVDSANKPKAASPYLTFKPYVSYGLTDKWTVGLDVPVGIWPDIVDYDFGVKPNVSYKLGDNASINAFYLFDLEQKKDADDSLMTNTVQIDFIWTF